MLSRFNQRIFSKISHSIRIMSSTAPEDPQINVDPATSEPPAKKEKGTGYPELSTKLIWIDCEMTGLDPEINRICEIAAVITEGDLTPIATFDPVIIKQSPEVMNDMSKWCKQTFKKNGLTKKIEESQISTAEAEEMLLKFLEKHTEPFSCALAGNSVNMDRTFIRKEMPKVAEHFHYRTVDVSTIKELIRRWYPEQFGKAPAKKLCHRAIDDIFESIEELRHYQKTVFIPLPGSEKETPKETEGKQQETA